MAGRSEPKGCASSVVLRDAVVCIAQALAGSVLGESSERDGPHEKMKEDNWRNDQGRFELERKFKFRNVAVWS